MSLDQSISVTIADKAYLVPAAVASELERLQALARQLGSQPTAYSWQLDASAQQCLADMCSDRDSTVRLDVGYHSDDSGVLSYGLLALDADEPEEGAVLLAGSTVTTTADPYKEPPGAIPELAIPGECPHIIWFDDADRSPLLFAGAGSAVAALKTWEQISVSWNAHLFVRVASNSRDSKYPSAHFIAAELINRAQAKSGQK